MLSDIEHAAEKFLSLMTKLRRLGVTTLQPEEARLSPSLMVLIDYVASSPSCGIREMAKGLNLSTPTVSVGVRQLEEAGFLRRQPHPRDRRAVQILLTSKGEDLYQRTHRFRRQMFERLLAGLTSEERTMLLSLLGKALDIIEDQYTHRTKEILK